MNGIRLKRFSRSEWLMGAALIAAGVGLSCFSLVKINASRPHLQFSQATHPTQAATPEPQKGVPAAAEPGGTRPTTPAPEPARPDPDAQKAGAQPALPPAPAEKVGPPIREK